jgi:hypothetical protein
MLQEESSGLFNTKYERRIAKPALTGGASLSSTNHSTHGHRRRKKGEGTQKKKSTKELNSAAVPYPRRSNPWVPQRRPSPLPSKPPPQEQEAAKSKPVLYLPFRDAGAVICGSNRRPRIVPENQSQRCCAHAP